MIEPLIHAPVRIISLKWQRVMASLIFLCSVIIIPTPHHRGEGVLGIVGAVGAPLLVILLSWGKLNNIALLLTAWIAAFILLRLFL